MSRPVAKIDTERKVPAPGGFGGHRADGADAPRLLQRLARASLVLAGIALLGLVAVQVWQVLARYVLNSSPSWTDPLTVLLLSTTMSLGAASAVQQQSHFSFRLLADAAPPLARRSLAIIRHLLVAGLGLSLALWSCRLLLDGWSIAQAGTPLPQSIAHAPIALGGLLMAVFAGAHCWNTLQRPEALPARADEES
jgi:TRAP-type C4-dicarboxylate transport system permease small subunit